MRSHNSTLAPLVSAGLALLMSFGCAKKTPELFKGGADSPKHLIEMALDRLAVKDTAGLQALRITRYEHDSVFIPNHPLGKAPKEMTDLNLVYQMMIQTNIKGLRRALDDYGGHRFKLETLEFPAPLEVFGPITLYRRTVVTVSDSTGEKFILPIFGEILTDGHRYKLAAYVD